MFSAFIIPLKLSKEQYRAKAHKQGKSLATRRRTDMA